MVLIGSRRFLVVLSCSRRFSMVLVGSQLVLVASQLFFVVLTGSRRFSVFS